MTAAIALPRQPHSEFLARLRMISLALGGCGTIGLGLARPSTNAAGNGLLNNLVAYWPMDEASGNLPDAHSGGYTLTQVLAAGTAEGLVYPTARAFSGSSYFIRSSEDAFQFGDTDFTVAAWLYNTQTPAAIRYAVSKYDLGTGLKRREWAIYYAGIDRWRVLVSGDGNTIQANLTASSYGAVGTGKWNLVMFWHDSVNDLACIQVDNTAADVTPYAFGVNKGTAPLAIGTAFSAGAYMSPTFVGRIGPVAMWQSAPGGGGVLTNDQRLALWNEGNGLTYSQFTTT